MGHGEDPADPDLDVELSWPPTQPGDPRAPRPDRDPVDLGDQQPAPARDDLEAAIEGLRADVRGLRAVVSEWPELGSLTAAVGELRGLLLAGSSPLAGPSVGDAITGLTTEVAHLRERIERAPAVAALAPVIEELGLVREELVALRRRIRLRAGSDW